MIRISSVGLTALLLASSVDCAGPSAPSQTIESSALNLDDGAWDSPYFLQKLADPSSYRVPYDELLAVPETVCGLQIHLQDVEVYDGSAGQSFEFVAAHQAPVGALERKGSNFAAKYCTGTLIAADLFITASHCVDSATVKSFVAFDFERAGETLAIKPQKHYPVVKVVEDGAEFGLDYALLRLGGAPGENYGWNEIRTDDPEVGELITIIQHAGGLPKQVGVGHLADYSGDYMRYADLDTLPGSSGSAVLDGYGLVSGIHTLGNCTPVGGMNSGVRMARIAEASPTLQAY